MATVNDQLKTEIENILAQVAEAEDIKNYELKPDLDAQVGDGFVANFYRGLIRDKDSGRTIKLAIKKAPVFDWDFTPIFKNEIMFYSKVWPALNSLQGQVPLSEPFNNVPKFLCSGLEPKKQYLAMEDLKEKGFVLFDKTKYLDKEHLEYIFKTYGKFHALSFILRKQKFEEYQEIHQNYTDLFHIITEFSGKQFEMALSTTVATLDQSAEFYPIVKSLSQNVIPTFQKEIQYTGGYRCSTHGDCWSNNMLFKYTNSGKLEDMKLVDFQLARDGTPVHDLSYFFYSGASKSEFCNLEGYLKMYHDALSEVIKQFGENPDELLSFDTLLAEWKDNALLGILMGIYVWQLKLIPKKEVVDRLNDIRQSTGDEQFEKFSSMVTAAIESDAFKEKAGNLLIHAYEFGILTKEKIVEKLVAVA